MIHVDTSGQLCPTPLILTKRALDGATAGDLFEVVADNETSCTNLTSYLRELKIDFTSETVGTKTTLRFTKSDVPLSDAVSTAFCSTSSSYVVVVQGEMMGRGSDELGKILMRAFINSLKEAERLPTTVVLYNAGVKLAIAGTDTAQSLAELEEWGVGVIACGTCVDYFDLKSQLAVGAIGNMFTITKILSEAGHILYA